MLYSQVGVYICIMHKDPNTSTEVKWPGGTVTQWGHNQMFLLMGVVSSRVTVLPFTGYEGSLSCLINMKRMQIVACAPIRFKMVKISMKGKNLLRNVVSSIGVPEVEAHLAILVVCGGPTPQQHCQTVSVFPSVCCLPVCSLAKVLQV